MDQPRLALQRCMLQRSSVTTGGGGALGSLSNFQKKLYVFSNT